MRQPVTYIAVVTAIPGSILLGGVTYHKFTPCISRDDAVNLALQCCNANRNAGRRCTSKVVVSTNPWNRKNALPVYQSEQI